MSISIPMILEKLSYPIQENDFSFGKFTERKTIIHDAVLLDIPNSGYRENRLYILDGSLTLQDLNGIFPINLLYLQDESLFYTGQFIETNPVFLFKGDHTPQTLVSEIQDIILYYENMFDHLLSVVSNEAGLQALTNVLTDYLHNPVMIFARGLKLLAYSNNLGMDYKPWLDTIENGYLVVESDKSHYLRKQSEMSARNKSPFIFYVQGMKYKIACQTIMKRNASIGTFQVFEYKQPITLGTLDLMDAMSIYLTIEINKNELVHFNNGILNGQLVVDLLENKVANFQVLKRRSENLGWRLAKNTFVLTIRSSSIFLLDEQLAKIRSRLNALLPASNGLVYDKSVVAIINTDADLPFHSEAENHLVALLKEWNLCCGISNCSNNLLDAAKLYKQSLQAIKFGLLFHPNIFVYYYSQFSLYDFFDSCLQNENINSYFHPCIVILKNYDEQHNTTLLNTINTYINNNNNQMETAKQMFIHRSTLLYRLHKIEELTGIDLSISDTIFHLKLSFKLLQYEEHLNTIV